MGDARRDEAVHRGGIGQEHRALALTGRMYWTGARVAAGRGQRGTLLSKSNRGDIVDTDTLLAFLAAVFAVPGATSIITAVIRRLSDGLSIDPPIIVYTVALALTGVLIATGAVALPEWTGDPALYIGAWVTWAGVTTGLAQRLYDQLQAWTAPVPLA